MPAGFGFGGTETAEFERNKIIYKAFGPTDVFLGNSNQTINGSKILVDIAKRMFITIQLPQEAEIISCVVYGAVAVGRKFNVRRISISAGGTVSDGDIIIDNTK